MLPCQPHLHNKENVEGDAEGADMADGVEVFDEAEGKGHQHTHQCHDNCPQYYQ